MSKKPESPITLVVRRGALRRFNKLQKETANLPVVVAWDRRQGEPAENPSDEAQQEERRRNVPFTWELADFIVVPADESPDEAVANDALSGDDDDRRE